jgi:hypothetical protein
MASEAAASDRFHDAVIRRAKNVAAMETIT